MVRRTPKRGKYCSKLFELAEFQTKVGKFSTLLCSQFDLKPSHYPPHFHFSFLCLCDSNFAH